MELKDLNSSENQDIISDNVVNNNELTGEQKTDNQSVIEESNIPLEKKESAADLILKKLSERGKNTDSGNEIADISKELKEKNISEINLHEDISETELEENEEDGTSESTENYNQFTKEQLLEQLKTIVSTENFESFNAAEVIKSVFYKKHKAEIAEKMKLHLDNGGTEENFETGIDDTELAFKEIYKNYKKIKTNYTNDLEDKKQKNLEEKYKILTEIENLINNQETINKTFEEFKILQKKWREIGLVPQSETKKLWESYNYHVERFYDYVKINKELRDLDLKRNLEAKIDLCEKSEELLLEEKVVSAFRELQKLHDLWKFIGPVPHEKKDEIWERFKLATTKINKKHQEYFENIKKEQENNLNAKILLCEKAEELITKEINVHKDWEKASNEILELQKIWKLIGFAPKKNNNKIYTRFRIACDKFFERKREFYAHNKEDQENNLQLKTDLCVQAESLKDSTDWKKTSDIFINLQKKWKTIGPVPRKYSDEIWNRFRAACNAFFEHKTEFFKSVDSIQDQNLEAKKQLIEQIEAFVFTENDEENLHLLKDFQKRWTDIGHVPIKQKDIIQNKYKTALDAHFAKLNIDSNRRNEYKLKNRIDSMKQSYQASDKLLTEREKLRNKVTQLQNKIVLWENNLGFFTKSEKSDAMTSEFKKQIELTRIEIDSINKQVQMLTLAINDLRNNKQ